MPTRCVTRVVIEVFVVLAKWVVGVVNIHIFDVLCPYINSSCYCVEKYKNILKCVLVQAGTSLYK